MKAAQEGTRTFISSLFLTRGSSFDCLWERAPSLHCKIKVTCIYAYQLFNPLGDWEPVLKWCMYVWCTMLLPRLVHNHSLKRITFFSLFFPTYHVIGFRKNNETYITTKNKFDAISLNDSSKWFAHHCLLVSFTHLKIIRQAYIMKKVPFVTCFTSRYLTYSILYYVMHSCRQSLWLCHHFSLWPEENPPYIEAMLLLKCRYRL